MWVRNRVFVKNPVSDLHPLRLPQMSAQNLTGASEYVHNRLMCGFDYQSEVSMKWDEATLAAERDRYEDWLMQQPFVTGVGIGYNDQGQLALKILTDAANAADRERVRTHIKGVPVFFEETGPVKAL
jgi:hypothetical protein